VYSTFLLVYTLGMLPGGYLIDLVGPPPGRYVSDGSRLGGSASALTGMLGWTGLAVPALFLPLLVIRGMAGAASVPFAPRSGTDPCRSGRRSPNGPPRNGFGDRRGGWLGSQLTYPVFGWLMDPRRVAGGVSSFAGAALVVLSLVWGCARRRRPKHAPVGE